MKKFPQGILPVEVVYVVKGISRQVIVVQSPDPKLFEQAIFILRDGQPEVSDEALLKEAKRLISNRRPGRKNVWYRYGPAWALLGGLVTSALWILLL